MARDAMYGLISGLPDEVAFYCLARVPFFYHQNLRLVCRSWRAALCGPELFKARREAGVSEELICVLADDPINVWQLYDPCRDQWLTLTIMPSQLGRIYGYRVASVAGKLFLLGGGNDQFNFLTDDIDGIFAAGEVWSYDPLCREWSRKANMLIPRAMFACCSLDGKIVVAGGFTSFDKPISKAEIYDPDTDTWRSLPDLPQTHASACSGVVIGGKIHVLHEGRSTVQILEDGLQWSVENFDRRSKGPVAVVGEEFYAVNAEGFVLKKEKKSSEKGDSLFYKLASSAPVFKRRIGFGMIGVGDDLCAIGGVIGRRWTNRSRKQLRHVDVLSVNSKPPIWRQASPMTRCRGRVLGCALLKL